MTGSDRHKGTAPVAADVGADDVGELGKPLQLVDSAAKCGADIAWFQGVQTAPSLQS
tara:strand:- start:184 stop:354 length:171 start_codon:yes stop_codon:yes gene_type:complete